MKVIIQLNGFVKTDAGIFFSQGIKKDTLFYKSLSCEVYQTIYHGYLQPLTYIKL